MVHSNKDLQEIFHQLIYRIHLLKDHHRFQNLIDELISKIKTIFI
jgi:hypothetical protein